VPAATGRACRRAHPPPGDPGGGVRAPPTARHLSLCRALARGAPRPQITTASPQRRPAPGGASARGRGSELARATKRWRGTTMAGAERPDAANQGTHRRARWPGRSKGVTRRLAARRSGRFGLLEHPYAPVPRPARRGTALTKRTRMTRRVEPASRWQPLNLFSGRTPCAVYQNGGSCYGRQQKKSWKPATRPCRAASVDHGKNRDRSQSPSSAQDITAQKVLTGHGSTPWFGR
jgi:hypothetical protein